jgi:hypothetical protein
MAAQLRAREVSYGLWFQISDPRARPDPDLLCIRLANWMESAYASTTPLLKLERSPFELYIAGQGNAQRLL